MSKVQETTLVITEIDGKVPDKEYAKQLRRDAREIVAIHRVLGKKLDRLKADANYTNTSIETEFEEARELFEKVVMRAMGALAILQVDVERAVDDGSEM